MKTSVYVMAPLLVGLATIAEPLVSWMLTDKWLPCVPFLRISCVYCVLQPVQTANLQAIRAIGRSDVILKLDIIKRGSGILFLLLLMNYGPIGIALAPVGMSLVATIVNLGANKKLINYSYREQLLDLLPNFLLSGFMGLVVFIINNYLDGLMLSKIIMLIIDVIIGFIIYVFLSWVTKNESYKYILETVKQFKKKSE